MTEVMEQVVKAIRDIVCRRKRLDFEGYCVGFDDYGIEKEILSIPEILIKDPDQSLPDHEIFEGGNIVSFTIDVAQKHMLKENWVKCYPREEKSNE